MLAFVIFVAAAVSDTVDGYLARKHNQVSELGQFLDPIADKLLLFATLVPIFWMTRHPTILTDYRLPWWGSLPEWVAIILVGRELLITGFRWFAKRKGVVIPAAGPGKLKATFQAVFIGATLAWFAWKDAVAELLSVTQPITIPFSLKSALVASPLKPAPNLPSKASLPLRITTLPFTPT